MLAVILVVLTVSSLLESLGISLFAPLMLILQGSERPGSGDLGVFSSYLEFLSGYSPDEKIRIIVVLFTVAILLKNLFSYAGRLYGAHLEFCIVRDFRIKLFDRHISSNFQFLVDRKHGGVINDIFTETRMVGKAGSTFVILFSNAITVFALYVLLLLISWQGTLLATGVFFALTLGLQCLSPISAGLGARNQGLLRDLVAFGSEVMQGIRQVKVFSAEKRLMQGFSRMASRVGQINFRLQGVILLTQPLGEIIPLLIVATVVLVMMQGKFDTTQSLIPLTITFIVVLARLHPIVAVLNNDFIRLKSFSKSVNVVRDLLTDRCDGEVIVQEHQFVELQRVIRFENVTFFYPGASETPALKGITFNFTKGQTVAIVGPSGAGKSTIIDLLARLYEPVAGRIVIDGVNIQDYDVISWRRAVGLVSQDTFIFNASIRDNITFGLPLSNDDEVIWAAEQADAHEFVERLPQGYDTVVGDRGLKLSGGQRQRLAIARAMIRRPQLIIFDEATSSLDYESEQRVQDAIERIRKDRTVILIAHRLSTIVRADKIVVIQDGRVVEEGIHSELIDHRGLYTRLYSQV